MTAPVRSILLFSALLVGVPSFAAAQERHAPAAQVGILCQWSIDLTMKAFGDLCFPEDKEFNAFLGESIERIEAFILKNSTMTRDDLEKARARFLSSTRLLPSICEEKPGSVRQFYLSAKKVGASTIREQLDKLLAVPRAPQMEPCL